MLEEILIKWKKEYEESENLKNERKFFLKKILEIYQIIQNEQIKLTTTEALKNEEQDSEMKNLWEEEILNIKSLINSKMQEISEKAIPSEFSSVVLEIRAGQGGDEASIFANDLQNMYMKLCKKKGWTFAVFSINYSECLGIKEGVFEITGKGVETWLLPENGVHCVKRVPKTEKKGRVHTSTATVAVLPEPKDIEINLNEKDCKIDVFRSSGPGGQSVNTTDSAVRITHIPTGIVVSQQDEKSQHKNKEKAFKILKARLFQKKQDEEMEKLAAERRQFVGKALRNEKIRSYHYVQNWVNDVRLEEMHHDINSFMEADGLDKFLSKLIWKYL